MANASTEQRTVVVSRDVPARLVPDGTRITIHKNSFVNLRQALGGTYTVTLNGNMARIDGTDADAIGQVRAPDIGQPHPGGSAVGFGHCASLLSHASPVDFLSGKRQNPFLTPVTIVRCGREG